MRIGIEAQRLLRPQKHGMDIVALELIRALQLVDHENEYFIFVRPDTDEECLTLRNNFTLVKIPGSNYVHWEQVALPKALQTYKLDLLHCTANTAPLFTDIPLILTLHDVLFLNGQSGASGINTATAYQRFGNRYRALLVRRLASRCQTILTVSRFAAQQIKDELNLGNTPVNVVYNGVSNRFTTPVAFEQLAAVLKKYTLPVRYFLFLGSADPRKNMKNTLQAFYKYAQIDKDIKMVISGKLPAFLKQLLSPEEFACILERCQFIGYIHDDDLPALYTMAEIFLFPSISEGFGLPILEAMACSTPVITSTLTAMPEVAGDAALLVNPHQPDSIADAMQQLVDKPLLRKLLIQRGKEQVSNFSWIRSAQQLQSLYKLYEPVRQETTTQGLSIA